MTWLAPWAFWGLIAVAGPVLIHWLARQRAERLRFPTLEFLVRTPPVSVRRHRVRDVPLLLVRIAIVAAVVAALAQPAWRWPGGASVPPAQAIVVDTSASMRRTLDDGRVGTAVADEAAAAYAGEGGPERARPAVVVRANRLATGIRQAAAWLAQQDAPRELLVVSDFQVGALVASDVGDVPAGVGIRLVPVPVRGPVPLETAPPRGRLRVIAGAEEAAAAEAAEAAARAIVETAQPLASGAAPAAGEVVAVIFRSAPDHDGLLAAAGPVDSPERFALAAGIQRELGPDLVIDSRVVHDASFTGLAIFPDADPGTLASARLMAAILRASAAPGLTAAEREPETLPPSTLAVWEREPAPANAARDGGQSGGRWCWALALILFMIESRMRRAMPDAEVPVREVRADAA